MLYQILFGTLKLAGISEDKQTQILQIIENEGVKKGIYKKKVNIQGLINKIRLEREDVAWVGMEIKGTNLIVKVAEADEKPEIINEDEFCNIVATKDGVVVKVEAQNGTPIVKEGDTVKKGDILVQGWIEGKYTGNRNVHAEGKILAKVWYSEKEKVYFNQTTNNQTGAKEKKYSINVNNFQINFFKTLSKFEKYDTIRTVKKLKITSNFYLPFEIVVNENYEKSENKVQYSIEQAKEIGINDLKNKLESKIQDKNSISNIYINTNETDEYLEVEVIYEVLENIGAKEKI